jgi:hypothetical protein
MNFRLTAILFGTIFVLAVVLLVLSLVNDDRPPTDVLAEELAGTKPEQIDAIEFEKESGAKLKIVRAGDAGKWNIAEPFAAKADPAAVEEVVGALLKAKPIAYPETPSSLGAADLEPPGLRVTLRHGDKSSTINLGKATVGGSKGVVFVTTSARPKRPMAVSRGAIESLFREQGGGKAENLAKWVGDFRAKQVFPADTRGVGDDVAGVTLSARGKTLSLAQSGRGWKFTSPAGWGEADPSGDPAAPPTAFTGVHKLVSALTSLQALNAGDFVENPGPQDLQKYGLNDGNPNRVTVDLMTKNGEKTRAFIGNRDDAGAPPPVPGMPPQGSKWWVKIEGQPGVIRANASADLGGLIPLIENPDPLRDRNLLTADKSRIDGIDLANGAVKLRKVGSPMWKLYGNPAAGDPQPAAVAEAERVVNALTERRTVKSFPAPNEANFPAGSVTVKVWADGFEANTDPKADPKAEPKEKGKPTTLTFGKKEGDAVNVKRVLPDGTTEYFLVPEKVKLPTSAEPVDLLAIANESRLDLLERDLKGFSTTNVAKLTVQGAANFDLDRDEKADTAEGGPVWRFAADAKGPAGQVYKKGDAADAQTVQGMLDILATTPSATRVVDETPTPEKLAGYGLGTATRLRVTVGLKSTAPEDKERVYEFGKETADPNFVYAQQRGRSVVFTLPKFIPDKFTNADLRNRSIFHVDPAQVARVEITGWGQLGGKPLELVAEKNKDGVWVATKPPLPGFTLDPNKIAALMNTLSSLKVDKFTADNTPEPRHGLNDDKQVFVVTLATATGAHHLHLRLGGPADPNGTTLYALTNRVPDGKPVVTVDAAPFKAYKEGPAAFAK